ncbi:MAG: MFS transporter [bacterium]
MKTLAPAHRTGLPGFIVSVAGVVLVGLNLRIAVTSIPPLLASLGLGSTAQSILVTLPIVCFAVGAPAGPALRRLFGEERAVFVLVALLAVAIAVRGAFPVGALFPMTLLSGLCIAVLNVHIPSLVKRRFPDRPGLIMALYTTAFLIGAGLAAWLTLPAKQALGDSARMGLGIWVIPAVLALAVWYPQLRVGKPPARTAEERALASVWRSGLAWQVTAFLGLSALIFYAVFSWLPQIDLARGISPHVTGYLLLLVTAFGVGGSLLAPTLARRFSDQRPAVIVTCLIQLAGFLGIFLAPKQTAIFWAAVFGIGNGGTLSLSLLLIVLRAADEHVAAKLSSMAQSAGYLITAMGPLIVGLLHGLTGNWSAAMWFLIACAAGCLLVGLPAGRDRLVGAAARSAVEKSVPPGQDVLDATPAPSPDR